MGQTSPTLHLWGMEDTPWILRDAGQKQEYKCYHEGASGKHQPRNTLKNDWLTRVKNMNVMKYKSEEVFQKGHVPSGLSFAGKDLTWGPLVKSEEVPRLR